MCGKKLLRDIQGQSYDAEYIYIYDSVVFQHDWIKGMAF